jgi:hypothetical protein
MANQLKDENPSDQPITLTMGALKEMLSALVAEMKKPHVDLELVARNEAVRQRMRRQREQSAKDLDAVQDSCSHMREDNTSRVAWAENFVRDRQLYVKEGFCQLCNKHYHPNMKRPHEYAEMLKVPVGKAGIIN